MAKRKTTAKKKKGNGAKLGFDATIANLVFNIRHNLIENNTLSTLRDTLIPYNEILVVSDGTEARVGTLTVIQQAELLCKDWAA